MAGGGFFLIWGKEGVGVGVGVGVEKKEELGGN